MKGSASKSQLIIGWREWCSLHELGLPAIAAKIDTGAKTSSLHAFRLDFFTRADEEWVRFYVHPVQKRKQPEIECQCRVVDKRSVLSSNGIAEDRPVIRTPIQLGPLCFDTEITLTNRDEMGYRMLIGRKTLSPRYIVDPNLSWRLGDVDETALY